MAKIITATCTNCKLLSGSRQQVSLEKAPATPMTPATPTTPATVNSAEFECTFISEGNESYQVGKTYKVEITAVS